MPRNQVQQHLYPTLMSLVNELHKVVVGAEAGVYAVIVDDVVPSVNPPGFKKRIEPDGRYSQTLDVIKLGEHALNITLAVPVLILVGRRIHLINDCILQPFRALCPGLFERAWRRLGHDGRRDCQGQENKILFIFSVRGEWAVLRN